MSKNFTEIENTLFKNFRDLSFVDLKHEKDTNSDINDFTKLRFYEEARLVKILEEDFSLKNYYDIFDNEEELKNVQNSMLSKGVKLNKVIAPRLYQICNAVKQKLNYNEEIDFYIVHDVYFNAFSINGFGYVPHMIALTSSLVQNFSDEELAFVIGHEIGHLIFRHSQINIVAFRLSSSSNQKMPTEVRNTIIRWSKYGEISCDRIGYIVQPNLETVGKVFFKLASGLSEEHLKFDIHEYLKQLDHLKDMPKNQFFTSHPNNLVRLKCLDLFAKSELYTDCKTQPISIESLKKETCEVLNLLEYHPRNDDQKKAVEFFASVGMYICCADKTFNAKESELIYEALSRYTSQPEQYLRFKDSKELI